jgi:hypothetical protein
MTATNYQEQKIEMNCGQQFNTSDKSEMNSTEQLLAMMKAEVEKNWAEGKCEKEWNEHSEATFRTSIEGATEEMRQKALARMGAEEAENFGVIGNVMCECCYWSHNPNPAVLPVVEVVSFEDYQKNLKDKVGSLMFPDDLHDSTHYVNLPLLKTTLGDRIPTGQKIIAVLVQTRSHENWRNLVNPLVSYKSPLCCHETQHGAYKKTDWGMEIYVSDAPCGDVIVVIADAKRKFARQ